MISMNSLSWLTINTSPSHLFNILSKETVDYNLQFYIQTTSD